MRDERKDLMLGRMALFEGFVSQEQIDQCVAAQTSQSDPAPLGQLLLERGFMTEEQLAQLLQQQAAHFASTDQGQKVPLIGRLAIKEGYCTATQVHECLRDQYSQEQSGHTVYLGQLLLKQRYINGTQFLKLLQACQAPELKPLPSSEDTDESCLTPDLIERGSIGKYDILYEISRGGMGVVYKAQHKQLGKEVALKILKQGKTSSSRVQRFKQEGQLVAQLSHPNIVQLYDWEEEEGLYYYTMEYIEGQALDEYNERNRLTERQAAKLVATVADAVHFAHGKGIIHRDLKPANVLIDKNGKPHLTDFGLAKSMIRERDLTRLGQALGTPSYMPPEQARGDKSTTDQRSDVYSLGAIFYELLTDQPPFAGINPFEYYSIILEDEPEDVRSLNPEASEAAERICKCAMAKEPSARYYTALAMAEDLEALIAGERILAGTLNQKISRLKWPILVGILGLALAIGSAILLGQYLRGQREERRIGNALRATEQTIQKGEYDRLPGIFDKLEKKYLASPKRIRTMRQRALGQLLAQANKALRNGRIDDLERSLESLHTLAPDHPNRRLLVSGLSDILMTQAEQAVERKQYSRAKKLLGRARTHMAPTDRWFQINRLVKSRGAPPTPKATIADEHPPRPIIPRPLKTLGDATWKTRPGEITGHGGKKNGFIFIGKPEWQDYILELEFRATPKGGGMFMRDLAPNCKFPNLLEMFGIRPKDNTYYKVKASVIGDQVVVQISGRAALRRINHQFRSGVFGFVAHPGGHVRVRKLRVTVLKPRPSR